MLHRISMAVAICLCAKVIAFPEKVQYEPMQPRNAMSAQEILSKGVAALGGKEAIMAMKGVSSKAYLEESVTPGFPDNQIATAGTQTISYDLSGSVEAIIQRIDREYMIGEFWYFGRPQLQPMQASIVTRSGSEGYSCYVAGNEGIYQDPAQVGGYTDPSLARVLLRDAIRLYPRLLLGIQISPIIFASTLTYHDIQYPAVTDVYLGITVAFNPDSYLPYLVRSYEDHHIYGNSTSDYILYNYTAVAGVQFPHRIKLMYNEDSLLIDTIIGDVTVNPNFPSNFFQGIPLSEVPNTEFQIPPLAPQPSADYGDAEVFENSQNLLWYGGFTGTLKNVIVTYPHPDLPNLIHLFFADAPGYTTTIANMGNAVMVTDAPPHQSKLVIQWVLQNLKKKVTHLLVTHHHHDHNYGAADYVAQGAKIVCPEKYKYYWQNIPGVQFDTATESDPWIKRSDTMQVRAVWPGVKDVHANDWMYFTFTVPCPTANSIMAVTVADAWSPGAVGYQFNQQLATEYLAIARAHRVPRNALVIPIHGVPSNQTELYMLTGYDYPNYGIFDFIPGGAWCGNGDG